MKYATFPWEQLGWLLRRLSLTGGPGNTAAWILFFAAGSVPLAAILCFLARGRAHKADILLAALSPAIYAGLWFFVNPSYIDRYLSPFPAGGLSKYALAAVIDSLLLTWILLRCLVRFETLRPEKLLYGMRILLYAYAALTICALLLQTLGDFTTACQSVKEGNSGAEQSLIQVTVFFLALRSAAELIPGLARAALLFLSGSFLKSCAEAPFGPEACAKMERLKQASGILLVSVLLTAAGCNVLQLFFSRFILDSSHRILLPLAEIVSVAGIRMLSLFYLESKRLKDDNAMFI